MLYYVVINSDDKTFNVFDEDNLEHIPRKNQVVAQIEGDENVNQVMKLIWMLRPDLEEITPNLKRKI